MVVWPGLIPPTIPPALIVATPVLALLQLPPVMASISVTVDPAQTASRPVMPASVFKTNFTPAVESASPLVVQVAMQR